MTVDRAISRIRERLPNSAWSDDLDKLAPLLTDGRGRLQGTCPLIVKPGNTTEAQMAVGICLEERTPVVPQGGNTGLVGGGTPGLEQPEILFSMQRMNSIEAVDQASMTLVADAGATLASVQESASSVDLLFPLSLASEGSCTIGGNIATNAGGVHVLRYGNMRSLVAGIEAILPDGSLWNGLTPLAKDNTGYDLNGLLCGSEGTLGLVTRATLRLSPRPANNLVVWLGFDSIHKVMESFQSLRQELGDHLNAFEILPARAIRYLERHLAGARNPIEQEATWHGLVELASDLPADHLENLFLNWFEKATNSQIVADGALATSASQANDFWRLRESLSEIQKSEGWSIKHDIALPLSNLADFVVETEARLEGLCPGIRPVPFGHAGDGNLHFNISQPKAMTETAFKALTTDVNKLVFDQVKQFGGSISAEHGIGTIRKADLSHYKDPTALRSMKAIKRALDPLNLFNPGRIFDL